MGFNGKKVVLVPKKCFFLQFLMWIGCEGGNVFYNCSGSLCRVVVHMNSTKFAWRYPAHTIYLVMSGGLKGSMGFALSIRYSSYRHDIILLQYSEREKTQLYVEEDFQTEALLKSWIEKQDPFRRLWSFFWITVLKSWIEKRDPFRRLWSFFWITAKQCCFFIKGKHRRGMTNANFRWLCSLRIKRI